MYWFMFFVNILTPLMMIFIGMYFKKAPNLEINPLFGYRTRRSMQNIDTWQFSNRLMGKYWFQYGWILLVPSGIISLILPEDILPVASLGIIFVQILVMFFTIYLVEKALIKKFGK